MTMMEDRLPRWAWEAPVPEFQEPPPPATGGGAWGDIPPSPPGFNIEPPTLPEYRARGGTYPTPTEMPVQQQPYIMPAGEMIGERMEWDSPYSPYVATDMLHPNEPWFDERYAAMLEAETAAAVADMGRTTTMGTGWGRQPLIAPPPTYDYTGTGGLGGLSPSIPFANTLMPPAGQEMMGNWGGGAANRQEWAGPLANPLMSPWAGAYSDPYNFFIQGGSENYNRTNPNWVGAQRSIWDQQHNDMWNYAKPLSLAAMTFGGSLPFYNPWSNPIWNR